MAANWGSVLDQLRAAGLLVDAPEVGRLTRCYVEGRRREKCGWYSLHEVVAQNGDRLIVGSYGVWTGADNNARKIELRKTEFSADQREAIRQRMAEDRKRADRLETEIAQLRRRVVARTPEELLEQLHGAVTTTRNEAGEIVAITRTDDEGRILFVIWERDPEPPAACSG